MSEKPDDRDEVEDRRGRPRAVVGSHRPEEEVFGAAFDGRIVRRIWQFVYPYRRKMVIEPAKHTIRTCIILTVSFGS